jgi:hypothetical protein
MNEGLRTVWFPSARTDGVKWRISSAILCVFILSAGVSSVPLRADDEPKSRAQVTNTDRADFPAGGVLRIDNSIGELTVEGWDRPDVEVATIKSTKAVYGSEAREKAIRSLSKVQIKTERRGNEVVVRTDFPKYAFFPPNPLPIGRANFDIEYRIRAPRQARLIIDHNNGEVHVDNVASDIRVNVVTGSITLRLPGENPYAIDAKTDAGGIFSDFPGQIRRRFSLIGSRLNAKPSQAAHSLQLRIGFGDIAIVKIRKPPYALYLGPTSAMVESLLI